MYRSFRYSFKKSTRLRVIVQIAGAALVINVSVSEPLHSLANTSDALWILGAPPTQGTGTERMSLSRNKDAPSSFLLPPPDEAARRNYLFFDDGFF